MKSKQGSTLFLRVVVFLMGFAVLALAIYALPRIGGDLLGYYPLYVTVPIMVGMYGAALPFFFALYQTLKLLGLIDRNTAFSEGSVNALRQIRNCGVAISIIYAAILPTLLIIADKNDAPGLAALGLVICFASAVIAVFAAVLERLLTSAIQIKTENDLTI
ncbi:DUF2975 domain-containing protein [Paenibacillus senegalimassiliensis]|uniref:DUF2975 domain-containing protein n=1 Tax=Paenibacillus senegalimassiliensis TaxID=1737426 RepID=UPI00073EBE2A|nr:DUF2975 domain-containing protein [Paenibacillus senegalimassiliensis]